VKVNGTGLSSELNRRIPELDGIRGIAIAMVLAHHYFLLPIQAAPATLPSYIQAAGRLAWSGVDLFFVLSGFLIGGILLDARDSSNYFRVFYSRRFLRIVPIYAACLLGAFFLALLVDHGMASRLAWMFQSRITLKSYLLFLQNFWMAKRSTYGVFGLGVTWSLAVEEQFYLTLPSIVRFLRPQRLLLAVLIGIVLAPVLRIGLYTLWPSNTLSWVVLMPCRADALLLGVLGSIALRSPHWRLEKYRGAILLAMVVLACGFVFLTIKPSSPYDFRMLSIGFTWLALFYLSILLCALLYRESWLARCLRWHWLGWLGTIAYGTYLLHEFVRSFFFGLIWSHLPFRMSSREFWVSVLALVVTLVIARASWLFFERPLVELGHEVRYEHREAPKAEVMVSV
jgi:peptidoglycan/LPS O-acetylase OafA/YrhL